MNELTPLKILENPREQTSSEQFINGLYALADFFARNTPDFFSLEYAPSIQLNFFVTTKADLVEKLRILARNARRIEKGTDSAFFEIKREFSPTICITVNLAREQVCRRVPTGKTRIIPAQPQQEVEEFEWVCNDPAFKLLENKKLESKNNDTSDIPF